VVISTVCGRWIRSGLWFGTPAPHRPQSPDVEPPTEQATQANATVTAIDILLPTTFHDAILPSPRHGAVDQGQGCAS
jgi:hypothetical protein